MGRWILAVFALSACTVEGARQSGDTCLNDRECAAPLRCELTPSGSMRCVQPTRIDASVGDVPDVPVIPDVPTAPDVQPEPDVITPRD